MIRVGNKGVVGRGTVMFVRSYHAQLQLTSDAEVPTNTYIKSEDGIEWHGLVTEDRLFAGARHITVEGAPELRAPLDPKAYRQTNLRAVLTHTLAKTKLILDPLSDEAALRTRVSVHVRSNLWLGGALDALARAYEFTWDITPARTVRINAPKTEVKGLEAIDESSGHLQANSPGFLALPTMSYRGQDIGACLYDVTPNSMRVEIYT